LGIVFTISILIENYGVVTGNIFGRYTYGTVLFPFIGNVPIAIGFAWINTLVPAMMISNIFIKQNTDLSKWISATLIGFLMVIFDVVLEKAAIELNYWHWEQISIPLQNYIAWFLVGFIFARLGQYLKVDRFGLPDIYQHIYLAQIGYFILVIIR
jgi:putative membrane protein